MVEPAIMGEEGREPAMVEPVPIESDPRRIWWTYA